MTTLEVLKRARDRYTKDSSFWAQELYDDCGSQLNFDRALDALAAVQTGEAPVPIGDYLGLFDRAIAALEKEEQDAK